MKESFKKHTKALRVQQRILNNNKILNIKQQCYSVRQSRFGHCALRFSQQMCAFFVHHVGNLLMRLRNRFQLLGTTRDVVNIIVRGGYFKRTTRACITIVYNNNLVTTHSENYYTIIMHVVDIYTLQPQLQKLDSYLCCLRPTVHPARVP